MRALKILATEKYIPSQKVTSAELDQKFGKPLGWVEKKSGLKQRYFCLDKTSSEMAALVAKKAVEKAGLKLQDIDCIVSACAIMEQAIPYTAALIQKQLELETSGISTLDINTTCLSFVTALDTISYLVAAKRYQKVLLISSEIASAGLNWDDLESCTIFGDGAAAAVLVPCPDSETSKILAGKIETYSKGSPFCEIRAGGTRYTPKSHPDTIHSDHLFRMDGKAIYKLAADFMPRFMERLLAEAHLTLADIDFVVPHQASKLAIHHMRQKLNIPKEKLMDVYAEYGNQVAASIPIALHDAITQQKIRRGDRVMLLGTSAGISIGGLIFEY